MKEIIENKLKNNLSVQKIFERIFEIFEYEIILDRKIREINPSLERQIITIIRDKVLLRETIFNISRKKRGLYSKSKEIGDPYDPFCQGERNTIKDELGTLENDKARIVTNIAKMAPFHSVLYFKKHDFEDLTAEDFSSAINLSYEWFEKIENKFRTVTQFLIWNYHFRAGASIYHPHFQLLAYFHTPFKILETTQKIENYRSKFQTSYLEDYFLLMKSLDLGFEFNNLKVWFPLTPIKDNEFNFYGDLKENSRFLWQIIKALTKIGVQSFNMIYFIRTPSLPTIGLFVDRGEISKLTNDFGTLEVFYHSVVSYNPFETAKNVFNNLLM